FALLGTIGLSVVLEFVLPLHLLPTAFGLWLTLAGALLFAVALALTLGGARTFSSAGTNVDPRKPALIIVRNGPYRFTRNPMYLGMVGMTFAVALIFSLDWALIGGVALWAILHFGVVLREESYLTGKFGAPYTDFTAATRRWL
ncbi:MAG: isoprenylcysteine carboxylmethyltransferase family protein, partial [bacterium]